jgi:histidinol-phosphate aminotransferase
MEFSRHRDLKPIHGSTDAGPTPQFDFSSNGNALGPNPFVLNALREVDPTHYPDPEYTSVRQAIATWHRVDVRQVAVGAGSSELILRFMAWEPCPTKVLMFAHTFGEYARAAKIYDHTIVQVNDEAEFIAAIEDGCKLAFLCHPNNPTGKSYSDDFLETVSELAHQCDAIVVIDLAYRELILTANIEPEDIPLRLWQIHSPGKAHGITGVRAGYLISPEGEVGDDFRDRTHSWVLSIHGEAFLRSCLTSESAQWLASQIPELRQWRNRFREELKKINLNMLDSDTNFGVVNVKNAAIVTRKLREAGIRVRDCTSFGLPEYIRLSTQDPIARSALMRALRRIRT